MSSTSIIRDNEIPFFVIGKPIERVDAKLKVLGKAIYSYDIYLPKMLYGKVKFSDVPHGIIKRVDVSKAENLSGVKAVVTGKDAPPKLRGLILFDTPTLAFDRVRYIGDPIAAVAAETIETAQKAVDLIDVDYEELPSVFDPEEAISKHAPIIHPKLNEYERIAVLSPRMPRDLPNVNNYHTVVLGDVSSGFESSDYIIENKYETEMISRAHIEPHSCVCNVEPDGTFTVYTSHQSPFRVRFEVSKALDVDESRVRVVVPYVGGGFGNRPSLMEPIACLLALKAKRPVKISLTREEVFKFTGVRPQTKIYIKDGVTKNGKLNSRYVKAIFNSGAYSGGVGIVVYARLASHALVQYKVKNLLYEGFSVYTNLPPLAPFRGIGSAILDFAIERQMDEISRKLGMDPIELRIKNIVRKGELNVLGEPVDYDYEKLLREIEVVYRKLSNEKEGGRFSIGIGISLVSKMSTAPTASSAVVKLREDGKLELQVGAVEIGTGVHTILRQIVAEEFQMPVDKVLIGVSGDTQFSPFDEGAFSSRTTVVLGKATLDAAKKLKEKILTIASRILNEEIEFLEVKGGYILSKRNPSIRMRLEELFSRNKIRTGVFLEGEGVLIGSSTFYIPGGTDIETGRIFNKQGEKVFERAATFYTPASALAKVIVDKETGKVKVSKLVIAVDVGKALNPRTVVQQILGGTAMGINIALYEEMLWDKGYLVNPDFKDYKLIGLPELPEITHIILESSPFDYGPYGARGTGEVPTSATIAAIANAISNAINNKILRIPTTPYYILKMVEGKE